MIGTVKKVPNGTIVGDGERASGDVVGVQLAPARPLGQIADSTGDTTERHLFRLMDHRDDEALVGQIHGDAEI